MIGKQIITVVTRCRVFFIAGQFMGKKLLPDTKRHAITEFNRLVFKYLSIFDFSSNG